MNKTIITLLLILTLATPATGFSGSGFVIWEDDEEEIEEVAEEEEEPEEQPAEEPEEIPAVEEEPVFEEPTPDTAEFMSHFTHSPSGFVIEPEVAENEPLTVSTETFEPEPPQAAPTETAIIEKVIEKVVIVEKETKSEVSEAYLEHRVALPNTGGSRPIDMLSFCIGGMFGFILCGIATMNRRVR